MDKTCCPQYAIKCEALNFKLNKSHKKVLKRVNKYLNTGVKPGSGKTETKGIDDVDSGISGAACDIPSAKMNEKFAAAIPVNIDYKRISKTSGSSCDAKASDADKKQVGASDKKDVSEKQSAKHDHGHDESSSKKVPGLGGQLGAFETRTLRRL